MPNEIPDDGTMAASIYGTAHIPVVLAEADADKIIAIEANRCQNLLSRIDLDLASAIMKDCPEIVYDDGPLNEDELAPELIECIEQLRIYATTYLGMTLMQSWRDSIEKRGRLVGLGEHSARATVSGAADEYYKAAVLKETNRGML